MERNIMRVLITGVGGFVGGSLMNNLPGYEVVGLARVNQDLATPDAAERIADRIARCDAIIHCAARIDKQSFEPSVITGNALATQQVLKLAAEWGAYVVNFSSIQVIGTPNLLPITEAHPSEPVTAYHAAKLFGEHLLAASGVTGLSLRLTAPVGINMPHNRILPVFVERASRGQPLMMAGQGRREQDYITVDDIAMAVEGCLTHQPTGVFNLGSGISLSNLALAERCIDVLNSASVIQFSGEHDPEESARWQVSIDKARAGFSYAPANDLEAVIRGLAEGLAS
jgi:UDP-glucose 4-epimerase